MTKYQKLKQRIFEIIEIGSGKDKISRAFDVFIVSLILLNVSAVVLESFADLYQTYYRYFYFFDLVSVIIFTIEYALRLWTANLKIKARNFPLALVRFMITPMALVDLVAILPFYLPMIIGVDLRFIRILRFGRLLRIFKLKQYVSSVSLLSTVLRKEKESLMITFMLTSVVLLFAAVLMFHVENEVQPEAFPNIFASMWWAIATLTTIGYGDIYPVTSLGRVLASVIALMSIGLVALPTGIISSGFIAETNRLKYQKMNKLLTQITHCPHCGGKLEKHGNE